MATVISQPTTTVTINAAFLQEIKEVNQELWQLLANLRELSCNAVSVHEHAASFIDMLLELRDQLALHFALEEAYGYFEDPAVRSAVIEEQASVLQSEHRRLYHQVAQLATRAEQLFFEGNLADLVLTIPHRFHQFDLALKSHESRENELIQTQYDEYGVGD